MSILQTKPFTRLVIQLFMEEIQFNDCEITYQSE